MTAELVRPTAPVASATVTILGTVSDPSGYPLAGVTVVLVQGGRDDEGTRFGTTTTDDVGGYRFTRVCASAGDDCRVELTDDSGAHVSTCPSFEIGSDGTTTLHTTMPVAGYIQGTVATQEGTGPAEPASHVCVTAAGEHTVQAVYVSARGAFRIGGLPAGRYTVVFHDDAPLSDAKAHWTSVTVAAGRTTTIEDQVFPRPKN